MRAQVNIILLFILTLIFACNSQKPKIDIKTYAEIRKKGNEISGLTQSVLLANVGQAMKNGGPVFAVEFCNLQASTIVDSLNQVNNCTISRISGKNRNPSNNLKTDNDKALWAIFEKGSLSDTIINEYKKLVYYKPIKTALSACLKCHGQPGTDIDTATTEKLQNLYPSDLATGYKLNDFRGLWKIEFAEN